MRPTPTPTPTLIRAPAPEPRGRRPASPTLVHAALDDQTLLALILERMDPETDPARLAAALLERFGSLGGVAGAAPGELAQASSAGSALRAELTLLREFAVRLARAEASRRPVITSWTALVAYVRAALAHEPREQFRTLFLDRRNILLRDEMTADGTVDHAPVYPREVIRRALELSASALILVHNHPSGDPTPSQADIQMTRQIVEAARVFNLQVHDHLVVGREGTASFKALGLI
ncbi:DNA repair protein RadC [Brevundimonas sp.]|uniref:RadC family protein n=1 Tax=Brevundimonas sp. TaxID=1871086 RepID=UPI0012058E0F|nr:DNA repair protein RadC [Brevundimonas sp.]TAJ62648.1 MAG: DNA repair protein RadC [Brevundimonas sp.]